jgi:integrase
LVVQRRKFGVVNRVGIPRKKGRSGFHTFRHSAASIVNEQTENLKLAQKFLEHSTIKMTADIYAHTSSKNRNNFAALN